MLHPKKALPTPDQIYLNVPSGSDSAIEVGTSVDVRTKMYFIGKDSTEFEGQHFTPEDLGGGYSFNSATGASYDYDTHMLSITSEYNADNFATLNCNMFGTDYYSAFPVADNTWKIGRIG